MIAEFVKEQRVLIFSGLAMFIGFAVVSAISIVDDFQILGVNRWMKPAKFFISTAIFMWTMAVYFHYLRERRAFSRLASVSIVLIFVIELFVIVMQAARGTTSHFNVATPLDGMLFSIMGLAIIVNTLIVSAVLFFYFRDWIELTQPVVWGFRLGIIVFLLGSFEGGYMSAQFGHGVGVADGGPGLPFVNWSTVGGDLRTAHFVGLHALQAIPIFSFAAWRFRPRSAVFLTACFAVLYTAVFTFLLARALSGLPAFALG